MMHMKWSKSLLELNKRHRCSICRRQTSKLQGQGELNIRDATHYLCRGCSDDMAVEARKLLRTMRQMAALRKVVGG